MRTSLGSRHFRRCPTARDFIYLSRAVVDIRDSVWNRGYADRLHIISLVCKKYYTLLARIFGPRSLVLSETRIAPGIYGHYTGLGGYAKSRER